MKAIPKIQAHAFLCFESLVCQNKCIITFRKSSQLLSVDRNKPTKQEHLLSNSMTKRKYIGPCGITSPLKQHKCKTWLLTWFALQRSEAQQHQVICNYCIFTFTTKAFSNCYWMAHNQIATVHFVLILTMRFRCNTLFSSELKGRMEIMKCCVTQRVRQHHLQTRIAGWRRVLTRNLIYPCSAERLPNPMLLLHFAFL